MTRVTGLETEFGVVCAPVAGANRQDGVELPGVERVASLVFRHRPRGYRNDNLFLPNGGRLYLDIGAHPEYATAECVRVRDLIAQDQAGRSMLSRMAQDASASLERLGTPGRIHVLANNTDSAGHTYGCHESYSVPRALDIDAVLPVLASFLATRPVLVGSGVALTGTGAARGQGAEHLAWGLSPRAPFLGHLASADTTGKRALVNTRDEPHADPTAWRRLHVTSADTLMAEPAAGLRSALTLLLLDALEAGEDFSDLVLEAPLRTLSLLGTSAWGDVPATTLDGRELDAVDIQEEFVSRLLGRLGREGVPQALEGADHLVIDLAPRIIDALRRRDAGGIDTEVDWAVKRRLMEAHRLRHPQVQGQALEALRTRVDMAFHDLEPSAGLTGPLRAQGALAVVCTDEERAHALDRAPATRAALRGRFVQACLDRHADFAVSWDSVRLDSPPTTPVDLPDPLASSDERVDALVAKVLALTEEQTTWIDPVGRDGLGVPG
ncbi:MAG: proteasome accessory factor PafA2 family protein [Actinomyces sp.]|uniref:proteasome accessory factor PafA2 family protein n=1 Tax=Actinomyces sp. TaxID=29317 RepID=UPI0026DB47BE|nr:proteasome accessory factor PafA2 family protein [Actinomyces sp.]MDO4243168.1 proteasome accessory factor PafA2 family protein [Actinomyces sp.]